MNSVRMLLYEPMSPRIYRIIRFRFNKPSRTIRKNLTLAEVREHCSKAEIHGPGWFDGYDYMPGCAPKCEAGE